MKINNTPYRSIWLNDNGWSADIIDQTRLPHEFIIKTLTSMADAAEAISVMRVRGAPLIGATAAYGMALAMREDASDSNLESASATLLATRPTAVNLRWALARMDEALKNVSAAERVEKAYALAAEICDEDVEINYNIGIGLRLGAPGVGDVRVDVARPATTEDADIRVILRLETAF